MKRVIPATAGFVLILWLWVTFPAMASTITYTYDQAGRLTATGYENGASITYSYDNNGNLLQRKTVTAGGATYTLTIGTNGTGSGTVTSNPAGINCGVTCSADFTENTDVTLTATPDADSIFSGWSGSGCSGTGNCTVTMDGAKTVTATFRNADYGTVAFSSATYAVDEDGGTATITVQRSGGSDGAVSVTYATSDGTAADGSDYQAATGTLQWSDGQTGAKTFDVAITNDAVFESDETVNLTLSNPTGGAALGNPASAMLTISNDDAQAAYTLTVQTDGSGLGTVTSNPAGINCGGTCSADFTENSAVTLTATPDAGNIFSGWSGSGCSGTGNCTVTMNGAKNVTATFARTQAGTLAFSAATYNINEDGSTVTITVRRSGGTTEAVTVKCTSADGSATQGKDYQAVDQTLTWTDGDGADKTVTVTILDDLLLEQAETLNLTLSNPTGGAGLGSPSSCVLTITDNETDTDGDGISDAMENQGPNNGDANGNGIPDSTEAGVAGFKGENGDDLVLVTDGNEVLSGVAAESNPSPGDAPAGVSFPVGFVSFKVTTATVGGCTQVTLLIPLNEDITEYYRYGPTPDNPADHWYLFDMDGNTGAEIFHEATQTRIVLHLCDGERGDHDLTANGEIDDPSGPAIAQTSSTGGSSGSSCFITTAGAGRTSPLNRWMALSVILVLAVLLIASRKSVAPISS